MTILENLRKEECIKKFCNFHSQIFCTHYLQIRTFFLVILCILISSLCPQRDLLEATKNNWYSSETIISVFTKAHLKRSRRVLRSDSLCIALEIQMVQFILSLPLSKCLRLSWQRCLQSFTHPVYSYNWNFNRSVRIPLRL